MSPSQSDHVMYNTHCQKIKGIFQGSKPLKNVWKTLEKKIYFLEPGEPWWPLKYIHRRKWNFKSLHKPQNKCFIFIDDHQPLKKVKITKGPKIWNYNPR